MASHDESCPFCLIANGQSDTEILQSVRQRSPFEARPAFALTRLCVLKDEELVCFRDVKPAADHHYLVIPRTHIDDCDALRAQHIPMVERMAEMGRGVLEKNKVRDLEDIRLGFHVPPFCSVPHLHLHALAPASKMNELTQRKYGSLSHWFIKVSERRSSGTQRAGALSRRYTRRLSGFAGGRRADSAQEARQNPLTFRPLCVQRSENARVAPSSFRGKISGKRQVGK
ncbi:adenosine 5'-monophosphoramidase HINT3-like [Hippocampus zosterae]|uniref:adenosine 5'-monophosphoramidase HINT3-like n=1 Tax=Hippocampus zosterae TaxID=109293 RepID=UPI00223CDDDF|nr:adenosine 5'-monophosphoramidase HINT3-like [Hippocampus zosterae]